VGSSFKFCDMFDPSCGFFVDRDVMMCDVMYCLYFMCHY
jgi:hypothetical protein